VGPPSAGGGEEAGRSTGRLRCGVGVGVGPARPRVWVARGCTSPFCTGAGGTGVVVVAATVQCPPRLWPAARAAPVAPARQPAELLLVRHRLLCGVAAARPTGARVCRRRPRRWSRLLPCGCAVATRGGLHPPPCHRLPTGCGFDDARRAAATKRSPASAAAAAVHAAAPDIISRARRADPRLVRRPPPAVRPWRHRARRRARPSIGAVPLVAQDAQCGGGRGRARRGRRRAGGAGRDRGGGRRRAAGSERVGRCGCGWGLSPVAVGGFRLQLWGPRACAHGVDLPMHGRLWAAGRAAS